MKKIFPSIIIFLISVVFSEVSAKSTDSLVVKGIIVCDIEDVFYDVIASYDSTIVSGESFSSPGFEMKLSSESVNRIEISSLLFPSKDFPINTKEDTLNLGEIRVVPFQIEEATISAYRPTYEHAEGKIIVNVKNNYLQNLGTAMTVLGRIPGVRIDKQGEITLMDGSEVTFFLNGQKMSNMAVLATLSSRNIESIAIDKKPSAKYDAETQAGIYITTVHKDNNHFSVDISNDLMFGRRPSDRVNFTLSQKTGGISNYLSLMPSIERGIQYDDSSEKVYKDPETLILESIKKLENQTNNKFISAFYALSWIPSENSELGFQYSGDFSKIFNKNLISQTVNKESEDYAKDLNGNERMHNFSLNYSYDFENNSTLSFLADYALFKTSMNEEMTSVEPASSNSKDDFRMLGFNTDYHLESTLVYDFGIDINMVNNSGENTLNLYNKKINVNENIYAAYLSAEKDILGFDVSVGLRGEFSQIKISDGTNRESTVDTSYFKIYPTIKISKLINDDMNVSLSFSQSVARPSFDKLNPSISIYDKISYSEGNPSLRPSIQTKYAASFDYKDLSFSVNYLRINDIFMDIPIWQPDEEIGRNIKWTTLNFDLARKLTLEVDYGIRINQFCGYLVASYEQPFFSVDVLGEEHKMNRPKFSFDIMAEYDFFDRLSLIAEYEFTGPHDQYLFRSDKPSHSLNLQLTGMSANSRFQYTVGVEDVFKTQRWNTWTLSYANSVSTMDSNLDSRLLYISVGYHFGGSLSKTKRKAANQKSIDRL